MEPDKMTSNERRATLSLAGIFASRMLGLFMFLPIFTVLAQNLKGATPMTIGLASGIYGFTQACLQIPFGMLSDKWGRKFIITLGLVLFTIGSILGAFSHTMTGVILARALQGAGAIGSTIMAFVADLTREEHRTKAMAMIGMVIGLSFSVAFVVGPIIGNAWGISGIFWLTVVLALSGILLLHTKVPSPSQTLFHRDTEVEPAQFFKILKNVELLRLDLGIFMQHAILTATFVGLPIALKEIAGLNSHEQWYFYLPILFISFCLMIPLIIVAEKKRKIKGIFLMAILLLGVSEGILSILHNSIFSIGLLLIIFFTAFNLLEATLPSLISKIAPPASKGTAMGIYSTSQFLGIFAGGIIGGWIYGHYSVADIFIACAILALIWFGVATSMKKPRHVSTYLLKVGIISEKEACALQEQLLSINGVEDVLVKYDDGVAYLKIDNQIVNKAQLIKFSIQE